VPDARLLISLILSVALHAAAAVAILLDNSHQSRSQAAQHWQQDPDAPLQLPPPPPPQHRLGIAESRSASVAWIGFDTPSPHAAPSGDLDQAALEIAAAPPPPPPSPQTQSQSPPTQPADLATHDPDRSQPSPAQDNQPTTETSETDQADQNQAPPDEIDTPFIPNAIALDIPDPTSEPTTNSIPLAIATAAQQLEAAIARTREVLEAQAAPTPPAPQSTTQTNPSQPTPPSPDNPEQPSTARIDAPPARDATPADRESDPSAATRSYRYIPGRPVAGEGLEIRTVRPQFDALTRLSGIAANPVVVIGFGHDGRAWDAQLTTSSGNPEIDRQVRLMALRWTAAGKALEQLPKNANPATDRAARLNVQIEIILR